MTVVGRTGVALSLALVASVARAQVVSGTVRNAAGGAPLPGAIVILASTNGARITGTLTDDAGRFRLRAPSAGIFTLRVDVVGYRSLIVSSFAVDSATTVTRDVVFQFERTALPTIAVTAASRCSQLTGDAGDAPRLWAEARKTLDATRLAVQELRFSVALRRYERTISLPDSILRASRTWTQRAVSQNPFESLSPETVSRDGFSVRRDTVLYYYAPDATVLLSDAFVAGHCFGTRRGGPAGTVGLSFRPLQTNRRIDIDGVLWLDSATAELRSMEYRYVPAVGRPAVGGGFVAFGRYPSGLWGVHRWAIRLPVLQVFEYRRRPDGALGAFVDTVVTALREEGGEVLTSATAGSSSGTRLSGFVFDSTLGTPLPGATVTVEGLGRTASTDSAGRFSFDSLADDGEVRVRVWHARLDSLEIGIPTTTVRLRRGAESAAQFSLPGVAAVARMRCARLVPRVITGFVRSFDDSARVSATEVVLLERRTGSDNSLTLVRHVDTSNDAARYAFCGVAPASQAWLVVRSGSEWSAPRYVAGDTAAAVAIVPLRLPAGANSAIRDSTPIPAAAATILGRTLAAGQVPRIDGWVLLSDEAPTASQVLVDDVVRDTTAADGSFHVMGVAEGTRRVTLRATGHISAQLTIRVLAGESQLLLATLQPAPLVVVQRRPAMSDTRLAEFNQRRRTGGGFYLDRAEITRRNPRTLTDLLRGVPGLRVIARSGGYTYTSTHFRRFPSRGGDVGNACDMMLYVDGQPFPVETGDTDSRVSIGDIGAIEVYVTAGSVPRRYAGPTSACGVILLWRG
ncbi:MAG TPA: carboxypeptidase regulatory-like domain-containing protein [Gemmatimonadaceae bacterium]